MQDKVNKTNEEHEKAIPPLFKVELMSWEEISEEIKEFPDLLIDYLTDVLKKVEDIREHYKKVSAMEKAHKILSDILAEFESNPNETPYLDIYSSQLARNFSYLESSLTIQINKLVGEIKSYKPKTLQEKLIMGHIESRDERGQ
ncbi:hypothetical protein [Bacillus cereus group sp. MYBK220-1]|uniref:hypothetical protein n=1 Tax=Bacillus cereus group sp. MYBK220-1 TaxID=3450660 RepID=UPI003F79CA50